jgi:hypothetical protein
MRGVRTRTVSALSWVGLGMFALGYAACGGPQEPGGAGDDCYRDADCRSGLVCVPSGNRRSCSNDVSGLVSMVEGPPVVEMPTDMDAAVVDDADPPPEDAEPPPEDAEPPPEDAEPPPEDAGTDPGDAAM